jgi:hypothetical protein
MIGGLLIFFLAPWNGQAQDYCHCRRGIHLAAFLASDASTYMTGSNIILDVSHTYVASCCLSVLTVCIIGRLCTFSSSSPSSSSSSPPSSSFPSAALCRHLYEKLAELLRRFHCPWKILARRRLGPPAWSPSFPTGVRQRPRRSCLLVF